MDRIILQGKNLRERSEGHEYLAEVMDFPEYYGGNLDALYECLTDICEDTLICVEYDGDELESDFFHVFMNVLLDAVAYNRRLKLQCAAYGGFEFDF